MDFSDQSLAALYGVASFRDVPLLHYETEP